MTPVVDAVEPEARSRGRHPVTVALRRWPTWLALGLVALILPDYEDGLDLALIPGIASVGYLLMALLDRPGLTWILFVPVTALVPLTRLVDLDVWWVFTAVTAGLTVAGLVLGRLRRPDLRTMQAVVAAVLLGLAITAIGIAGDAGRLLVALALIGHAATDLVLWRANRVVSRSFAEWCGVLDLTLGAVLIAVTLA
ncbi:MAG TPA: hypothetical protein VLL08_08760 [Kineosporiaceae bacterium]|nr:hypothetical protein [Kineosporiaceae bacterium]